LLRALGISHGSAHHTDVMKIEALKQALDLYGFDVAFGGARRDEEKSRAKERIFSFRAPGHRWEPKAQRPERWNLYNTGLNPASPSGSFRFPTGPRPISGNTSAGRTFRLCRFTLPR
jgi:3'-phosphoadenosine 5'-phosphosulfate sulfotransferase (PAPS reductase)/FAD synthetase